MTDKNPINFSLEINHAVAYVCPSLRFFMCFFFNVLNHFAALSTIQLLLFIYLNYVVALLMYIFVYYVCFKQVNQSREMATHTRGGHQSS